MNRILFALDLIRTLPSKFARSAVIWIWAVTALRLANFILVLPMALRTLPREQLGLWYLMLNVVGLVTLVEFGLSAAISRQATFFWAEANKQGESGNTPNWSGLSGLVALATKIYSWLGWGALFGCLGGGVWLALMHPDEMLRPAPLGAFFVLLIAGVLRMRGLFWNPLLFGVQRVRDSQRIQFTGILLSYAVSLGGLLAGGRLLALAGGQAVLLLYPLYRSKWIVKTEMRPLFHTAPESIPWRPIWSSTWRAGAILLGAWLGTYGLVFAAGQTTGLSTSASYSLSNLVAFLIHFSAQSWLLARYPTISGFWATGDRSAIAHLALRRISLCMATFVGGALAAWIILPYLLHLLGSKTPALPRPELGALFIVAGVDLFVALHSSVLTSCNLFPQMRAILTVGIATFLSAFLFGSRFGVWGILAAPLLCQGLVTVWLVPTLCWRALRDSLPPARNLPTPAAIPS
ncbi:MAG: hypothetical protein JO295_03780 [Verrucomicrobia bacterium]|nr:hypothetical protein [Verrucomicrobiota bacterium]